MRLMWPFLWLYKIEKTMIKKPRSRLSQAETYRSEVRPDTLRRSRHGDQSLVVSVVASSVIPITVDPLFSVVV
jgi:hypothetical protein